MASASTSTPTLFPTTLGKPDAWYTSSVAGQPKGTDEIWDGSGMKADGEIVDAVEAPVVIHDDVIPAPVAHVPRKPWGSVTLSTGKLYTKDQVVPDAELPKSRHHPDFKLALQHNEFVGNGKKIAASKARRAAAEKAEEEAARKEAAKKAASLADFARRVAAQKSAAQKPVAAAASSTATAKKASSNTFAALDDSEED